MGQFLHGSATTTEAVRRAMQHSQESLRDQALLTKAGAKKETRVPVPPLETNRENRETPSAPRDVIQ